VSEQREGHQIVEVDRCHERARVEDGIAGPAGVEPHDEREGGGDERHRREGVRPGVAGREPHERETHEERRRDRARGGPEESLSEEEDESRRGGHPDRRRHTEGHLAHAER
jgi:hypothetical protein